MEPSTSPQRSYEFGPFRLDAERRVLAQDGVDLGLRAKALDLLLLLIRRRGEAIPKDELLSCLWPDTEVGEHNLVVTMAALRKALGEKSGENRYIATLPGRGYMFVAEIIQREESVAGEGVPKEKDGVRTRWRKAWVLAAVAVLVAAVFIRTAIVGRQSDVAVRSSMLTFSGKVASAALSPDGKRFAYVSGLAGEQSVHVNEVGGSNPRELVAPAAASYSSLSFAPDGNALFFVGKGGEGVAGSLYSVSVKGGAATRVRENVSSAAVAPDGDTIAFTREDLLRGESVLVLSSLRSSQERILAMRKLPGQFEHPAWSPDGKRIGCVEVSVENGARNSDIIAFELDGAKQNIAKGAFNRVSSLTWPRNSAALLASGRDHKSGIIRLWSISAATGRVDPLTGELNSMIGVVADTSGRRATAVQQRMIVALWIAPAEKWGEARRVLYSDTLAGRSAWMPKGELLLETDSAGAAAFGVLDIARGTVRPFLPRAAQSWMPTVCGNGEDVFYRSASAKGKGDAIWRSDVRGGTPVEASAPLHWASLSCAQDVYYAQFDSAESIGIWRMPRDGGKPTRLSKHKALWPQLSPDGRWLACFYSNSDQPHDRKPENLAILPAEGGEAVWKFPLPANAEVMPGLAWNADSTGVHYVQNHEGASGIWLQKIRGGAATRVVEFPGEKIMHFAWSPDWKQVVVSRAVVGQDVVLLEGLPVN